MGVGMARERVTDCTACSHGVSRGEQCWGRGRGILPKRARDCLLRSLVPNQCDLSPGSHPVAEPRAFQAVRVREHVCAGGESGVCPGACCTRQSECPRRALHGQGAAL